MLNEEWQIESIFKSADRLPTLPGIALKILEVIKKEDFSLKELGDILSTDPPLSAKVLKIINSPLYGIKVSNVYHAVNLLGVNIIKNLTLSFSLIRNSKGENQTTFDYTQFWKNSLITAITMKWVLQKLRPWLAEDGFFLGLIHDIGILLIVQNFPKLYSKVLRYRQEENLELYELENKILGLNHMQLGAYITNQWDFPEQFTLPIHYHHQPQRLKTQDKDLVILTQVLHWASSFVNFFQASNKTLHLALLEQQMKEYSFKKYFTIEELMTHVQGQTQTIFPMFELSLDDDQDYLQIVQEARQELINISEQFLNKYLEQKKQIEKLENLASHDGLTGLNNHQKLMEVLNQERARMERYKSPFSLCLLDIDNFKSINDTYGHVVGDQVLKKIGDYLKSHVRQTDIVARYAGDEFAVVMPDISSDNAYAVLDRLRRDVSSLQIHSEGQIIFVTICIGIASVTYEPCLSIKELLQRADKALYEAKHKGKNKCIQA